MQQTAFPTEPRLRRFSLQEYGKLVALGLFEGQRVELLNGRIITMPPMLPLHSAGVLLVLHELASAFPKGHCLRPQMPLHFPPYSAPEPDVAVVQGRIQDYLQAHPTKAELVVEVSYSTLNIDRRLKAAIYSRGGIDDYWIVNVKDMQLEVHRDPQSDPARPRRRRYATITILNQHDTISPLAAPGATIAVRNLLPLQPQP